jgi:hypothetical protein
LIWPHASPGDGYFNFDSPVRVAGVNKHLEVGDATSYIFSSETGNLSLFSGLDENIASMKLSSNSGITFVVDTDNSGSTGNEFSFTTTALGEIMELDDLGNLQIDADLTVDGNDIIFGNGATIVNTSGTVLTITEATTALVGILDVSSTVNLGSNSFMTLDENEIDVSSGDLALDVVGNIELNADGGTITFKDNLATLGTITSTGYSGASAQLKVTDNESTAENNLITFVAGAIDATGNVDIQMDGDFHYNPSTGTVTATAFAGAITGDLSGNITGSAATVTGAADPVILPDRSPVIAPANAVAVTVPVEGL